MALTYTMNKQRFQFDLTLSSQNNQNKSSQTCVPILKRPIIKNYDLRCSRGCVRNWTRFGQKPPVYQICDCVLNLAKQQKLK